MYVLNGRYELQARGCIVHAEAQVPSRFITSDGRVHVLCNDRIDHIVIFNNETALIEIKRAQATGQATTEAKLQLYRYFKNYTESGNSVHRLYCIFFQRRKGDVAKIYKLSVPDVPITIQQRQRMEHNRMKAIATRRGKSAKDD